MVAALNMIQRKRNLDLAGLFRIQDNLQTSKRRHLKARQIRRKVGWTLTPGLLQLIKKLQHNFAALTG